MLASKPRGSPTWTLGCTTTPLFHSINAISELYEKTQSDSLETALSLVLPKQFNGLGQLLEALARQHSDLIGVVTFRSNSGYLVNVRDHYYGSKESKIDQPVHTKGPWKMVVSGTSKVNGGYICRYTNWRRPPRWSKYAEIPSHSHSKQVHVVHWHPLIVNARKSTKPQFDLRDAKTLHSLVRPGETLPLTVLHGLLDHLSNGNWQGLIDHGKEIWDGKEWYFRVLWNVHAPCCRFFYCEKSDEVNIIINDLAAKAASLGRSPSNLASVSVKQKEMQEPNIKKEESPQVYEKPSRSQSVTNSASIAGSRAVSPSSSVKEYKTLISFKERSSSPPEARHNGKRLRDNSPDLRKLLVSSPTTTVKNESTEKSTTVIVASPSSFPDDTNRKRQRLDTADGSLPSSLKAHSSSGNHMSSPMATQTQPPPPPLAPQESVVQSSPTLKVSILKSKAQDSPAELVSDPMELSISRRLRLGLPVSVLSPSEQHGHEKRTGKSPFKYVEQVSQHDQELTDLLAMLFAPNQALTRLPSYR
jgi:hypothetical protein